MNRVGGNQAEDASAFVRKILNFVGAPVLLVDPSDRRIVWGNEAARAELPTVIATSGSPSLGSVFDEDSCSRILKAAEKRDEIARCHVTVPSLRSPAHTASVKQVEDGGRSLIAITLSPGDFSSESLAAVADGTGQREGQEARRQFDPEMIRAQKIESLGALAAGVAHDFNNLLTGILGYTELLRNMTFENEKVGRYVGEVEELSKRAAELTRQLLVYSGGGEFVVQPIDVNQLVREFAPLLHAALSRGIDLEFDLQEDLPAILADAGQVKQALMNIVRNAAESFEGESGDIRVRTYWHVQGAALEPSARHPAAAGRGTCVAIEVSDNGTGMGEEELKRARDPFYSAGFAGRGLGLSASHEIVKSHGGGLHFSSEVGEGTTVTLLLPIREGKRVQAGDKAADLGPAILVVDDEEPMRSLESAILKSGGYDVLLASNGKECLDHVRSADREIALILLDMVMPEMDGEQTLEELRTIAPEPPIIVVSGIPEDEVRSRIGDSAVSAVIQKPFQSLELLDAIKAVLSLKKIA